MSLKKILLTAIIVCIIIIVIIFAVLYLNSNNNTNLDFSSDELQNNTQTQDEINKEIIDNSVIVTPIDGPSTASPSTSASADLDIDKEIKDLDAIVNTDDISDLSETNLSDSQLGI